MYLLSYTSKSFSVHGSYTYKNRPAEGWTATTRRGIKTKKKKKMNNFIKLIRQNPKTKCVYKELERLTDTSRGEALRR